MADQFRTLTNEKNKHLVYRLNTTKRTGIYYLEPNSAQRKWVTTIRLVGFTVLPSGFRKDGGGFASRGYLILRYLSDEFGKFKLIVDAKSATGVSTAAGKHTVTIQHADLRDILRTLRRINTAKFAEQRFEIESFLHSSFPKHFDQPEGPDTTTYGADELSTLLAKKDLLDNLSNSDINALATLFPDFLERYVKKLPGKKKLLAISGNKKAVEIVYLDKIITEFEKKLGAKTHNEQSWQEFLREYILLFNSNYASTLEKENVSFRGRYPDFLLIDAYNYLDIYEIKKPNTTLMRRDRSRGNYYWDTELSKAISQVENYTAYAERNGAAIREEIRKRKGVEVRILKPRGFIIAGQRAQLKNEEMEDNFRLLNNSLKNIEVVLYDELLNNLRTFLGRLKAS